MNHLSVTHQRLSEMVGITTFCQLVDKVVQDILDQVPHATMVDSTAGLIARMLNISLILIFD